ncbi:MICOS complex subunit MIC25 isoform 3-T5 [Hipposideros larvatus]
MGSIESREGRRVSFGMDEEERVRVLQGIRLSENVVNRMKNSSQPSKVGQLTFPPAPAPSAFGISKGLEKDSKLPRSEYGGSRQPSGVEEDLKRYKQEQATVQDELFQAAREREAAMKHLSASLHLEEGSVDQEKRKSVLLARELESQEAELRRCDTFYKEQLGHIEKKVRLGLGCLLGGQVLKALLRREEPTGLSAHSPPTASHPADTPSCTLQETPLNFKKVAITEIIGF